jgi:hypothetical protein
MKKYIITALTVGLAACVFASAAKASNYNYPETSTAYPPDAAAWAANGYNHTDNRVDLWDVSATSGTAPSVSGSTSQGFAADFEATIGDIINGPWGFLGGYGHSLSGTGENVAFGLITYNFTSNTNGGGFNSGAIVGYDKLWGGHQGVEEINSFSGGWQVSYSGDLNELSLTNVTWAVTAFQLIATPQTGNAVGAVTGLALSIDVYSVDNFDFQPTFIYESRNGQGPFDGNYALAALAITHGW